MLIKKIARRLLISAAFLFQFGTGPISGFAITLVVGLLSNIFTSTFVSKTLFEIALARRHQVPMYVCWHP